MKTQYFLTLTAATFAMVMIGCSPQNRGTPGEYRVESRTDRERGLGSADVTVATDQMTASIANEPRVRKVDGQPTIIVMDRIENRTSMPSQDYQLFLARIRASLNQSGARDALQFVETRYRADAIKEREGLPPGQHGTTRTVPEYALTGAFYDLPRGGTNYYLLTFQLVDLRNEMVVWENSYEVKVAY